MKDALQHIYHYHQWRVNKFAAHLTQLDDALLDKQVPGSFPTFRALLRHTVWAEDIWQARIFNYKNGKGTPVRELDFPADTFGTLTFRWKELADAWLDLVNETDAYGLQQPFTYRNVKGDIFSNVLQDALLHVADHSTYHSGQIVTALRMLGQPTVSTNVIFYLRERG